MEGRKVDPFDSIPPDVVEDHIASYLRGTDAALSMPLVSHSWCRLVLNFSDTAWESFVEQDFRIAKSTIKAFKVAAREHGEINFKLFYRRLHRVHSRRRGFSEDYGFFIDDPKHHFHLLICCSDLESLALKELPRLDDEMWLSISLSADNEIIWKTLEERNRRYSKWVAHLAIRASNKKALVYLAERSVEIKEKLQTPCIEFIALATQYAEVPLFNYLKFNKRSHRFLLLDKALAGRNRAVLRHLIMELNFLPTSDMYSGLAATGDVELIKFVLANSDRIEETDHNMVLAAVSAGNLEVTKFLLTQPGSSSIDLSVLMVTARSIPLINYFRAQGTLPVQANLEGAAWLGDLEVVDYLLNANNNFGLKVDAAVFKQALESGNPVLVTYLEKFIPANEVASFKTLSAKMMVKVVNRGFSDFLLFILNPYNGFTFSLSEVYALDESATPFTMIRLIKCELEFKQALTHLRNQHFEAAIEYFTFAARDHVMLFMFKSLYIFTHQLIDHPEILLERFIFEMQFHSDSFVPSEIRTINQLFPAAIQAFQAANLESCAKRLEDCLALINQPINPSPSHQQPPL